MKILSRRLLALGLATGISIPSTVLATNGYFLIGYGAKSRAMGGAAVAFAQDGMISASNPAGLADVGTRADIDAMLFYVKRRAACCVGPDGVVSGANLFLIPSMGAAMKFNRKLSIGFAATGAGSNTRYNANFFIDDPTKPGDQPDESSGSLGVNLMQMVMSPGAAYNISSTQSIGASLLLGVQSFRAYGMNAFKQFSHDPDNVTNRGNDYAYGAGVRLGWRGKFFKKKLTVGATYASRVYMTKFDKYKGLFAEEGSFDIPENYAIGFAVHPTKKLSLAFDVARINYADINSVGNPSTPIAGGTSSSPFRLGLSSGPGFGWEDQTVYKFGIAYQWSDKWTYRRFNHAESPIPEGPELEFATVAPATVEDHVTLGASYQLSQNSELNFAYMHAFKNTQKANLQDTNLPFNGDVEISLVENALEIGYAYKFQ